MMNLNSHQSNDQRCHQTREIIMHNKLALAATTAALLLTGCAGLSTSTPVAPKTVALGGTRGSLFGGQQPISGAAVQLYQTGTTGYGTGATALVSGQGVTTDANGNFTLTGTYHCTAGTYVYATSTGGNPGGGTNRSATQIVGLGLCDNLSSSTFISMNEVTTVGTVWALAPFMNGMMVGAPGTNQAGLAQAFADINTLVNTASGQPVASTATVAIPVSEINTLADILAACINSTGAGDSGNCDTFFSKTTVSGVVPGDTVSAALNIARNPGTNVSSLLNLVQPTAPFQPTLSSANDFTVSVIYSGNGIAAPTSLAVDASGNVWAANSSSVTELSHTGAILSGSTGYAVGGVNAPSAIAIDPNGNAWVANKGDSSLTTISASNFGYSQFSDNGLSAPTALAFDGQGNLWVANGGSSSVSAFSQSGSAIGNYATPTPAVAVGLNPR